MAARPTTSRKPLRAVKQVLVVLALTVGVLPFFPGVAQAHHADIAAAINCNSVVSFTATAWAGDGTDASRTNSDVRVWYTVNGGPAIEVTHGAFSSPGFSFAGTFSAPTAGNIDVHAQAIANWGNGVAPGDPRETGTLIRPTNCGTPNVTFSKDGPANVAQNGTVTYHINVQNTGTAASQPITVADAVDARYSNVTASSAPGSCTVNGNSVSCSIPALAANGGSAVVTIAAQAPANTCPTIPNVASVKQGSGNAQNTNTVSTNVTGCAPNITFSKDGPATITQGGTVTYHIAVHNGGNAASQAITVTDAVDTRYSNVTASSAPGSCQVNGSNVNCSIPGLAAGGNATVTITAQAPNNSCPTIPNVASVMPGYGNPQNTNTVSTTVTGCVPQVTFSKDGPATVGQGGLVTYHVSVHNGGNATSDPITVTDAVDARYTNVGATASVGSCNVVGNGVSCSIGQLAAGDNATVTITAHAPTGSCPTIPNVAAVKQGGGNPQNTNSVTTTVTGCTPNITIQKTASETSVAVGDQFDYTLTVANTGNATAPAVQLTDSIPAGLTIVTPLPSGCTATGNDITCALGDLVAGASASRTFTVEAGTGACPDVDNFGTVTVGGNSSNSNTVNVNVLCDEGGIAVRIVKDNNADGDNRFTDSEEAKKEGADVPFRLVITNTGDNPWTFTSLEDTFAHSGLDLLDSHCADLAGVTLQPGEDITCTFTLRNYSPAAQTTLTNTVEVCVEMVGDATKTDCDHDTSRVRSAKVLGKTITPTPPGGTAFTGSNGTLGFGFAALFLLMLGTGLSYLGYRRRARFDG